MIRTEPTSLNLYTGNGKGCAICSQKLGKLVSAENAGLVEEVDRVKTA